MGQELDRTVEAVHAGEDGMAAPLRRGDRAAGPVDQVDQGNPVVEGEILAESTLAALATVAASAAAAADGEILAADGDRPAVDLRQPHDVRRRDDLRHRPAIVFALPGELADLLEGVGGDAMREPFSSGEGAPGLLALAVCRATRRPRPY